MTAEADLLEALRIQVVALNEQVDRLIQRVNDLSRALEALSHGAYRFKETL